MSDQEGFTQEERSGVYAGIVRPRTYGGQGHKVTRNTRIYQSVNQKGGESPTLTPHRVKDSNLGGYITIVHLCDEVPHKLPEGQRPKPIKL